MSLYASYLKEREGLDVLETYQGFVTYKFRGPDCYIQDVYVLPEFRMYGVASFMADQVAELAKRAGIRILTGSVDANANGADASDKVLRAYGMKPYAKEGFVTYYSKEIL
jgi:ribosomal protein S18 acetylase RimI-like enzyme